MIVGGEDTKRHEGERGAGKDAGDPRGRIDFLGVVG